MSYHAGLVIIMNYTALCHCQFTFTFKDIAMITWPLTTGINCNAQTVWFSDLSILSFVTLKFKGALFNNLQQLTCITCINPIFFSHKWVDCNVMRTIRPSLCHFPVAYKSLWTICWSFWMLLWLWISYFFSSQVRFSPTVQQMWLYECSSASLRSACKDQQ